FGASIGPLFLALGVFFGLGWRARPSRQHIALENAAIVSLVGLVIWAIMGRLAGLLIQSRLYLSIFPALAMLAGMGFVNLTNIQWPGVRLGRVAGVLVMLVFGFNLLQLGVYTVRQGAIQVLLGLWSPETYLARNLGMYALAMQGIDELPEDARVLMLWEPRSFYCAPRCLPDEILDRWLTDRNRYHTPEAILRSWRQAGFTHVLFRRSGADFFRQDDRYQPSDWETLDDLFAELPIHTDLNQVYTLYSLTP
ncbi:MAG: hypothetical protein ACE5GO_08935, partial [Anaerolineales bacterium]